MNLIESSLLQLTTISSIQTNVFEDHVKARKSSVDSNFLRFVSKSWTPMCECLMGHKGNTSPPLLNNMYLVAMYFPPLVSMQYRHKTFLCTF